MPLLSMVCRESMPFGASKSLLIFTRPSLQSHRLGISHIRRWKADTSLHSVTKSRSALPEVGSGSFHLRTSIFPHHSVLSSRISPAMGVEEGSGTKPVSAQEQTQKTQASEGKPEVVELGDPPEKPLPGDCCGQGCTRCIWDVYFEELADYKKRKELLERS